MIEKSNPDIIFIYDGECPICQMGASLYKVRQSVGQLHTVDARMEKDHPSVREATAAGFDFDVGMVIHYQDQFYQGDAALHIMAQLGVDKGWFNRIGNRLFKSKALARLCYPSMRATRNVALAMKGVGKIRNLGEKGSG